MEKDVIWKPSRMLPLKQQGIIALAILWALSAAVLPARPVSAQSSFDDACAMLAATKVAGYSDEKEEQWLSNCGGHPNINTCLATKRFIEDSIGRPAPQLVCKPASDEAKGGSLDVKPGQHPDATQPGQLTGTPPIKNIVKGMVVLKRQDGYIRLSFQFEKQIEMAVTLANISSRSDYILVVKFDETVDVPIERLRENAPELISAVRRDPDGRAIRIALARQVRLQTIPTRQGIILDLLPMNWTGALPAAPD